LTAGGADGTYTALVLAGSRGPSDPVAAQAGLRHKALVPVAGVPMILRVLRALAASRHVGRIVLCLDDPAMIDVLPEAAALAAAGRLSSVPTAASPSLSVGAALRRLESPWPLLVTTADHPLLTTAMVDHFVTAVPADADVAVALAPAALIRRAHPGAVRTFYRLGREAYSGCNLFAFRTPRAEKAAVFWAEMERHRKRPWRLIAAIGPLTLLRFLLGILDLRDAERLLSRRTGAAIRIVEMPFAEAAIDVDKPADLVLAEKILRNRP
jgi:CTP:molybdopterin cytidylyltransferase MocA